MQQQTMTPIRAGIVEDQPIVLYGLKEALKSTPEGDIICVGTHIENSEDLPLRVNQWQADVVIVDLVLKVNFLPEQARRIPRYWGIDAMKAILRECSPRPKLIAFTQYAFLRDEALEVADAFGAKSLTNDEVRDLIRSVMGKPHDPVPDRFCIGRPIGVELSTVRLEYFIQGERRATDPIRLAPTKFALLHYLVLERQQKASRWLERLPGVKRHLPQCQMKEPQIWQRIAERYDVGSREAERDVANISLLCTRINGDEQLRQWHDEKNRPINLIRVRDRRREPPPSYWTLHTDISREGSRVHPADCRCPWCCPS